MRHNLNLYRIDEIRPRYMDIAKVSCYDGSQHDLNLAGIGGEITHLHNFFHTVPH